jgi:hypothetical protein
MSRPDEQLGSWFTYEYCLRYLSSPSLVIDIEDKTMNMFHDKASYPLLRLIILALLAFVSVTSLVLASGCTTPGGKLPPVLWTRQFGSVSDVDDIANAVNGNGDIFVTGYTQGTFLGQNNIGIQDAFISSFNSKGQELWKKQFGTSPDTYSKSIAATQSGIYVVGYTNGTFPGQSNSGLIDAFITKFDSNGNIIWTKQFGSDTNDYAYAVSVNSTGIYVSGTTYGNMLNQINTGGSGVFLCKFDFNGNIVWTRQLGSELNDYCYSVFADEQGVYVAGITNGTLAPYCGLGGSDGFVYKFDGNGNIVWMQQFGSASNDYANAVTADANGIYVLGITYGQMTDTKNSGGSDVFLVKFDQSGSFIWTRQFGTSDTDFAWAISAFSGNVYLTGYTAGSFTDQFNIGKYDAYCAKYDVNGNPGWIKQFGTDKDDYAKGIFADSSGVFITGSTMGAFSGQNNGVGADVFIVKLGNIK